ncbi:MAG: DUF4105 domain-containing protein [Bacteroidia bacterium]|nr:DUF4105 domain-containing protein [Bacteroidia bacterium]
MSPCLKTIVRIPCLLLLLHLPYTSQGYIKLSDRAEISLLTIAPGDELYSAFGHSGLRVFDPEQGLDTVYNYGTFDFGDVSEWVFYLNFVKGKLNYRLDNESFRRFERVYHYYRRTYTMQQLDLTPAQCQRVYDFLVHNNLPENRVYAYDFFYDNCATRIRDLLVYVLGDTLRLDQPTAKGSYSFREMLNLYLTDRHWAGAGINLALGMRVDHPVTHAEQMFHPDYLAQQLGKAQILRNGTYRPLVKEQRELYRGVPAQPDKLPHPLWIWSAIAVVAVFFSLIHFSKARPRYIGDGILFVLAGLSGLILLLLWVATSHKPTAYNLNIAWLLPTHLLAGIWLLRRKRPAWLQYYFLGAAGVIVALVLSWIWLPQALPVVYLPLMLALALRSWVLSQKLSGGTK